MALSTLRSFEDIYAALLGAARDGLAKLAQNGQMQITLGVGLALSALLLTPSERITRFLYRLPRYQGKDIPFLSPPTLLMGSMGDFFHTTDEFIQKCEKCAEDNPDSDGMVLFQFPFNFLPPMICVTSQEHAKEVLGPKMTMASDRASDPVSGEVIGKALFTVSAANGDWKRQHRVCMRGFGSPHKLREYAAPINARVAQFVDVLTSACGGGSVASEPAGWRTKDLDIKPAGENSVSLLLGPLLETLTLRIISDVTVCGAATQEELLQFQDDLEVWLRVTTMWTLQVPGLKYLPLPSTRRFYAAQARMTSLVDNLIQRSKDSGLQGNSFVEELLKAGEQKHGSLTDEEVRHNVFGFIIAGNITTADSLHSSIFMLARHPEVQEQLFEEVRHVSLDDMLSADTPVLDAVLHETLRMYPPAPMTGDRTFNAPVEACGLNYVPPLMIAVNSIVVQRFKVWGDDSNTWRPSRWTDGTVSQDTKDNFFTAFGAGVRQCIGRNMSLLESRTALAGFVQAVKVREREPEKFEMTLVPRSSVKPGLGLVVERR